MKRIILASASPRRKELLEQIGLTFEVTVSNVPEVITKSEPSEVVEELLRRRQRRRAGSNERRGCDRDRSRYYRLSGRKDHGKTEG